MRLKTIIVTNYKSIIDSTEVEINSYITALVGKTGAGKTSFLEMISGIDKTKTFKENELPHRSEIEQKFLNNDIVASDIKQLEAVYTVEETDIDILPDDFKKITEIKVERFFDGHIKITPIGDYKPVSVDIQPMKEKFKGCLGVLWKNYTAAKPRVPTLVPQEPALTKAIEDFDGTDFLNIKEVDISLKAFINFINQLQQDGPFQTELNQRRTELNAIRNELSQQLEAIPTSKLYEIIPNPLYLDDVFELEDKVSIDNFISDPTSSATFNSIAIIGGLKQSGLQKIRNADTATQSSYLDVVSERLSQQFNKFWSQEKYSFRLTIHGAELHLTVIDDTTNRETSILERSDGFKWWTAFFLTIATFLTEGYGMNILLLDGPATNLHDEGKGDVLRFLTKAVESNKLQILYTTHERALIDPWRLDRIRLVEKKKTGTILEQVRSDSKADLLNKIRLNIGSPARYSLFGAPRTISFEGISDIVLFSAFNEYLEQEGMKFLHKDSYSVNAFNGLNKAPQSCDLYKNLGLEFGLIVDSGSKTREMESTMNPKDFKKYFIEIKEVSEKDESDIEDLIHPELYHLAFSKAYEKILDAVPTLDQINNGREEKKTITKYQEWFKEQGDKGEFNKTIVAYQMIKILMQDRDENISEESLNTSVKNILKLIEIIKKKF